MRYSSIAVLLSLLATGICMTIGCSDDSAGPDNHPESPMTGDHIWSRRFGDVNGGQHGTTVAVDGSGNVFVAGDFYGTVDFGGGPLTSAGHEDIFLAKLTSDGDHLWSKRFGDASIQGALAVAVDAPGNVVVTGYFGGTVDFGGGPLTSAGYDIFVAKYTSDGTHMWSKRFGGAFGAEDYPIAYDIAVDGSQNVIIAGSFEGAVNFGGGALTSLGSSDIFIAKYSSNGDHQWSRAFGGSSDQIARAVAVDESGNVVITGSFFTAVDFGGGELLGGGMEDVFVAKLASNGAHIWSKGFGDANGQYATGIAVDGPGNVSITGSFKGAVDFGGGALTNTGPAADVFIAAFGSDGAHLWSKRFGDGSLQYAWGIAVDESENPVVTGYFLGTMDFGGGTLTSIGNADIFIAKFESDGTYAWSKNFGDGGAQEARAVTVDGSENVIVAGFFEGVVDFGGGALTSAGGQDIFVAKFER